MARARFRASQLLPIFGRPTNNATPSGRTSRTAQRCSGRPLASRSAARMNTGASPTTRQFFRDRQFATQVPLIAGEEVEPAKESDLAAEAYVCQLRKIEVVEAVKSLFGQLVRHRVQAA